MWHLLSRNLANHYGTNPLINRFTHCIGWRKSNPILKTILPPTSGILGRLIQHFWRRKSQVCNYSKLATFRHQKNIPDKIQPMLLLDGKWVLQNSHVADEFVFSKTTTLIPTHQMPKRQRQYNAHCTVVPYETIRLLWSDFSTRLRHTHNFMQYSKTQRRLRQF